MQPQSHLTVSPLEVVTTPKDPSKCLYMITRSFPVSTYPQLGSSSHPNLDASPVGGRVRNMITVQVAAHDSRFITHSNNILYCICGDLGLLRTNHTYDSSTLLHPGYHRVIPRILSRDTQSERHVSNRNGTRPNFTRGHAGWHSLHYFEV